MILRFKVWGHPRPCTRVTHHSSIVTNERQTKLDISKAKERPLIEGFHFPARVYGGWGSPSRRKKGSYRQGAKELPYIGVRGIIILHYVSYHTFGDDATSSPWTDTMPSKRQVVPVAAKRKVIFPISEKSYRGSNQSNAYDGFRKVHVWC